IGLFVFIAINIILGVKEFGEKKTVAKVLIVAVLINFRLLFTKVIVDASNFTAYQFYNSMVKGMEAQSVSIGDMELTKSVIAGSFMRFMGVKGIADAKKKLEKVAKSSESGFLAILYGLLSLILLLAVALVFLYGAFLIFSRAVLIIFLMLTSALAFASWLIPHQFISEGFQKWWKSLLKSSFLAPILIAFLWMTLKVSDALSGALKGPMADGTLGKLAENASSEQNIVALMNFALILGLLYASIATANMFSKSISGFRFAQAGAGAALLTAPALAWRFTGAPFMRQTAGRFGFWKEKDAISEAKARRSESGQLRMEARQLALAGDKRAADKKIRDAERLERTAATFERDASRYGTLARAGYNVGDVGLVKKLGKTLSAPGLSEAERGQEVARGFAQAAERRIAEGEKRAQKLAVSGGEKDKIYQDKYAEVRASRAAGEKSRAADVEREKVAYEVASATPRADRDRAQQELNRLVGENVRIEDARHFAASHRDPAIQRAAQELVGHQYNLDTVRTRLDEAEKELMEFHGKVEAEARGAAKTAVDAAEEGVAEAARAVGRKAAGILATPDLRKHIGDEVRGKFRSGLATKSLRDALALQMKELGSGAAPARPAPGAGGP
ncbi:hypothetical protein HY417_02095, partial [Candidatus Kaiserbacteria bacterium]|nr:hypothetical protein [Candidatus Kaiserbacteria bacterium]